MAEGSYVDRRESRTRFGEYARQWIDSQPHRATTAEGVETIYRKHIGSIRTSEVQAWVAGLELAPSTVNVVYGKLAAILRAAVDDRVISSSPCSRRIRLLRQPGAKVLPMPPSQVVKAVQRHLGHASATTTLDTYAHLWPDCEDVTRRALDAGLAAIVSPSCHEVGDAEAN